MKTIYSKICFGAGLLGSLVLGSCTGDYMDYNRNWAEVTADEMQRDEYLISSLLGGMQNNVIPAEEHLNQFTECLLGGIWGGYVVYFFKRGNFNPVIGIAAVGCVPTTAKVAQKIVSHDNPSSFVLADALGANVTGVITSAVIAAIYVTVIPML